MDHESRPGQEKFEPLSETMRVWGQELIATQRADRKTQSGVLGFGRSANDMDAVTIYVAPNTDLTDKEIFPEEVEGERVVYEHSSFPDE